MFFGGLPLEELNMLLRLSDHGSGCQQCTICFRFSLFGDGHFLASSHDCRVFVDIEVVACAAGKEAAATRPTADAVARAGVSEARVVRRATTAEEAAVVVGGCVNRLGGLVAMIPREDAALACRGLDDRLGLLVGLEKRHLLESKVRIGR